MRAELLQLGLHVSPAAQSPCILWLCFAAQQPSADASACPSAGSMQELPHPHVICHLVLVSLRVERRKSHYNMVSPKLAMERN